MRVTTDGGLNPVWAPDGKELYYLNPQGELMSASLSGTNLSGRPQVLFKPCQGVGRIPTMDATRWSYDVTADGKRFLFVCGSQESSTPSAINVIVNWQSTLK
jgi:Tol biopolymer transport system component